MIDFQNDPDYEECLVTFFDVLGFRNLLHTRSGAEIRHLLSMFRRVSEGDATPARRSAEARMVSEAHTEIVSDAIVRSRTIETQYQVGPLVWEIIDLLHIQIECVANGLLVRGAMAIGPMHLGIDFTGPVFGPGLIQAYLMEDAEVIFPRIAIHEDVIERHRQDQTLWREGYSFAEEERALNNLLRQDESGLHHIDYLRASFSEIDGEYAGWVEFLGRHKTLVENGFADSPDATVRRKYNWLKNYHNAVIDENLANLANLEPGAMTEDGDPWEDLFRELRIDA